MPVTITHSTLADGTFSATGAAAWDATHTVSGLGTMAEQNANNVSITGGSITGVTGVLSTLTVNSTPTSGGAAGQIMFDTGSVLQESSNLVWDNTNKKLTITGATVTTSQPVLDMTQTWNAAGTTFTGLKFNATDTASASASLLMDLQVGGVSKYSFDKSSDFTINSTGARINFSNTNTAILRSGGALAFLQSGTQAALLSGSSFQLNRDGAVFQMGASIDVILTRRAAANLRFGAADAAAPVAQTLSVQSVVAGTTNTAGANLTITGSQGTGTGAGGRIIFQVAPAGSSGTAQNALGTALTIDPSDPSVTVNNSNGGFSVQRSGTNKFSTFFANPPQVSIASDAAYGWASTTTASGANDTILTRRAAANVRLGLADAAAPVAQTLSVQSVVAGTFNTAGANLTITGSQGTGTGAGGNIIFQVAPSGLSGTAQNALATALSLNADVGAAGGVASFTSNFNGFGGTFLRNTNTGPTASTGFSAQNDSTSYLYTRVYGTGVTSVSVWGITLANYAGVFSDGAVSNGLLIGTVTADPIIFGTNTSEKMRITSAGLITFGGTTSSFPALKRSTTTLQARLADDSGYTTMDAQHRLQGTAPASATATGTAGDIRYDADYIYICTATDTWKRVAIATWP